MKAAAGRGWRNYREKIALDRWTASSDLIGLRTVIIGDGSPDYFQRLHSVRVPAGTTDIVLALFCLPGFYHRTFADSGPGWPGRSLL